MDSNQSQGYKSVEVITNNAHDQENPNETETNQGASRKHSFRLICLRICQVIKPVVLCAFYSCLMIRLFEYNVLLNHNNSINIVSKAWMSIGLMPSDIVDGSSSYSQRLVSNIIIVASIVTLIVVVTLIVLLLFYMNWHSCLTYYFYLPSLFIMVLITPLFIKQFLSSFNCISLDYITLCLIIYNFTALGLISIFNLFKMQAPLAIQQLYLIHNSALLAVMIVFSLPVWTSWLLLCFLVVWDLFAVLAPFGPLNLIINMAEKEGVIEMPGLIYSTHEYEVRKSFSDKTKKLKTDKKESLQTSKMIVTKQLTKDSADVELLQNSTVETIKSVDDDPDEITTMKTPVAIKAPENNELPDENGNEFSKNQLDSTAREYAIEERGVNIGLGDFIFYSLLIGLTCKGAKISDFHPVLAAFNTIVIGLILTLLLLATTNRALPALPISIALGIVMSSLTMHLIPPLSNVLSAEMVFI